jgi:transcriptional regulator NrdR family protein
MLCECGGETYIVDSRSVNEFTAVKRRRKCKVCLERFNTLEIPYTEYDELLKYKEMWERKHEKAYTNAR